MATLEVVLESYPERRFHTCIKADEKSVDFSTCDEDGGEHDPSFELTWEEIFQLCKEHWNR